MSSQFFYILTTLFGRDVFLFYVRFRLVFSYKPNGPQNPMGTTTRVKEDFDSMNGSRRHQLVQGQGLHLDNSKK